MHKIFFIVLICNLLHGSEHLLMQIPQDVISKYIFSPEYRENNIGLRNNFLYYCDGKSKYIIKPSPLALTCKHFEKIFANYYKNLSEAYLEKYFLTNFLYLPNFTFIRYTKITNFFTDCKSNANDKSNCRGKLSLEKIIDSSIENMYAHLDVHQAYEKIVECCNRIENTYHTTTLINLPPSDNTKDLKNIAGYYAEICNISEDDCIKSLYSKSAKTAVINNNFFRTVFPYFVNNLFSLLFTNIAYSDFPLYKKYILDNFISKKETVELIDQNNIFYNEKYNKFFQLVFNCFPNNKATTVRFDQSNGLNIFKFLNLMPLFYTEKTICYDCHFSNPYDNSLANLFCILEQANESCDQLIVMVQKNNFTTQFLREISDIQRYVKKIIVKIYEKDKELAVSNLLEAQTNLLCFPTINTSFKLDVLSDFNIKLEIPSNIG